MDKATAAHGNRNHKLALSCHALWSGGHGNVGPGTKSSSISHPRAFTVIRDPSGVPDMTYRRANRRGSPRMSLGCPLKERGAGKPRGPELGLQSRKGRRSPGHAKRRGTAARIPAVVARGKATGHAPGKGSRAPLPRGPTRGQGFGARAAQGVDGPEFRVALPRAS